MSKVLGFGAWCVLLCGCLWGSGGLETGNAWAQDAEVPKLPLLQLKGYFRFRGDIMHNMAMGVGPREELNGPGATRAKYGRFPFPYPISAYPFSNSDLLRGRTDYPQTMSSANMRFRLQSIFNVSENLKIHTTLDFLDNVVLGSTPRGDYGLFQDPFVPLLALSQTQVPPRYGDNSFSDSIRVRHMYADIRTPFGLLRLGRMPSHWGLGILANNGMKTNSDFGDSVDRVMFITRLFGHYIIPGMDFVSSGPLNAAQNSLPLSQPFDPEQGDDARQFLLAIARMTRGAELNERKEKGEIIVNYGVYFVVRQQQLTAECDPSSTCTDNDLDPKTAINNRGRDPAFIKLNRRDALAYIPDVWFRLLVGEKLRIEFEATMIFGSIGRAPNQRPIDLFQWGAALEFEYRLLEGQLWLGFNFGIASGDRDFASRWAFNADTDSGRDADGQCRAGSDPDGECRGLIGNFQFDPGYNVDMILWREMYGAVTNGWYAKAHLTYNIMGNPWEREDGIGVRLAGIYSMALVEEATLGKALPLGVELNGLLNFASSDGYSFIFAYGILFPLPGMSYAIYENRREQTGRREELRPSIAQRFWFRFSIRF